MNEFEPISYKDDLRGLVWNGMVSDTILAELQTGVVSNILHLVFFDTEDNNKVVYTQVGAYTSGDTLDEAAMEQLNAAIDEGLASLA